MRIADRNGATAYLMRSQDMLEGDVEAILALYLKQCSVLVTCRDLAVMAATLANGCVNPLSGKALGRKASTIEGYEPALRVHLAPYLATWRSTGSTPTILRPS